jgi:hypothetical protein
MTLSVASGVISRKGHDQALLVSEDRHVGLMTQFERNAASDLSLNAGEGIEAVQGCFDAMSASDVGKTLYASQGHGRMARWFTSSLLPRWCENRAGDERHGGFDQPLRR